KGAVSGVLDHLAGRAVHVLSGSSGRQRIDTGTLRPVHGGVDLAQLVGGRAEGDGPCDVGGVTADLAAGIDEDHVARSETSVPGASVRQRGRGPELHETSSRDALLL